MTSSQYTEKVDWLFNQFPVFQKVGVSAYKPTLDNTLSLIQFFNVPIDQMKFVHVAGTNGKGTTCSVIASALTASGKKVGLFTSPHIKDFRERIRVNGAMISEEKVVDYINRIQNTNFEFSPSFFEMTWVMALAYFYEQKCDIVVVETGLGGRLDATNVIAPELSVITNIGLDHVAILGDTREKIASEKAGIIKQNVPVIIGESDDEISHVFIEAAESKQAPISFMSEHLGENTFEVNKRLAFEAVDFLLKGNPDLALIKSLAVKDLYQNTGLYGRNQIYSEQPLVILDAAHNTMGIQRFILDIQKRYSDKNVRVLYGASNDKDLFEISNLFPQEWEYYITEFNSQRTTKIEAFKAIEKITQLKIRYFSDAKEAFLQAKKLDYEIDMLIVFGSFFLLEEII
ncbi:bifunctional folylpolyglutamate synthase/dihydrofolate synthase [Brumimicrobium glaciale]|uniref:Dihydrofolate synthase/folylpolyglutamate synthase n=1 Tax=Brumimicrobium glaciale TaxID=200475 RepID=A0A4Q4KHC3_9FLAO|nr:Mur ligase family protein [Brumimicrobium glaciale]RYM32572.1 bifunctional folylpolyglutamate synthase/dihydrofolate synthase [Brumimicrobium glaciale]